MKLWIAIVVLMFGSLSAGATENADESGEFQECMHTLEQSDHNVKQIHANILSLCSDPRKGCGETKKQEIGMIAFTNEEMKSWIDRHQEAVEQARRQSEVCMVLLDKIESER
jgi:hypothetical protein